MRTSTLHPLIEIDADGHPTLTRRPVSVPLSWAPNALGGKAGTLVPYHAGIDTLVLWYPTADWGEGFIADLERKKATTEERPELVEAGPYTFEVLPHGAAGGFAYILRCPLATVLIQRSGGCQVTIRAIALAALGPTAAVEEMTAIVGRWRKRGHMGQTSSPMPVVSRLDLCVDLPIPVFGADELERMVTRARVRTLYSLAAPEEDSGLTEADICALTAACEAAKGDDRVKVADRILRALGMGTVFRDERGEIVREHNHESVFYRGDRVTGISAGRGQLVMRIYDKLEEAKNSGKGWMLSLLRRGGHRGGPVTRVEFQLRKHALDSFDAVARCGRRWDGVRELLGAIWRYCVGSWATLRERTENLQRARWPIDPLWKSIQDIELGKAAPMRRSSLGNPPRWVDDSIRDQRRREPWIQPSLENPQGAVAAEIRRTGLHRGDGPHVLRHAEMDALERLSAQAHGVACSMAAIIGGPRPLTVAAHILTHRPGANERIRVARARRIYRGAHRLALGAPGEVQWEM